MRGSKVSWRLRPGKSWRELQVLRRVRTHGAQSLLGVLVERTEESVWNVSHPGAQGWEDP